MENNVGEFLIKMGKIRACSFFLHMIEEGWISSFDELKEKIELFKNDTIDDAKRMFPELSETYGFMFE